MVGRMIRNTMCEIGPNSSAAIISRAFSAHGDCRLGNGTDTQAPRASARSARPLTTPALVPIGFSIMNGMPASIRYPAISGISTCRPRAITNSGFVASTISR